MNPLDTFSKRECVRCKAPTLGGANRQAHLCADIAKRLARRERQVQAVLAVYREQEQDELPRGVAESIVKVLSQLGVEND